MTTAPISGNPTHVSGGGDEALAIDLCQLVLVVADLDAIVRNFRRSGLVAQLDG